MVHQAEKKHGFGDDVGMLVHCVITTEVMKVKTKIEVKCECCRTTFVPRHASAKYCSGVCRDLAKRAHMNGNKYTASEYYVRKFLQSPLMGANPTHKPD